MKSQDYLVVNGKVVKFDGNTWKIIATTLGRKVLVSADCVFGTSVAVGTLIDLISSRKPVAKEIRTRIGLNLVS